MEWLAGNWVSVLVGIGFVWLLARGGMMCGGHSGHGGPRHEEAKGEAEERVPSRRRGCH